ncbi:MAG: hypothetical protein SH847_00825 [Roseiflexaceae bacterium]|nr:hypothetical protein [Roseiflexaceae bacterium]
MAKFILMYTGGGTPTDPAEQAAVMDEWIAWYNTLGAAIADPGNPFTPLAKAIASDGTVSDIPASTIATGYTIINAETIDQAVAHAKLNPVLKSGGQVSVYEGFNMG